MSVSRAASEELFHEGDTIRGSSDGRSDEVVGAGVRVEILVPQADDGLDTKSTAGGLCKIEPVDDSISVKPTEFAKEKKGRQTHSLQCIRYLYLA